ncbi:hypothetical protein BDZ94DRAFT_1311296 [Collybia nuda]|uniref:Mitogen-activated protein kinase kinase kinase 1 n=1 Tax=Collybia nuda TaxID=64659 RepID=A0A9P6CCH3_9AGAR|nr:hypothetical protein BDZ94DRAFT_1311296 [Collybia nuda]
MGLKRKIGEDFMTWAPGGQTESVKPGPSTSRSWVDDPVPPVKKARTKESYQHSPKKPPTLSAKQPRKVRPSTSAAGSQATSPKLSRAKDDADILKPEKRGAIFKKKCPQNILDRVDRVMSQRFCMLNRRKEPEELKEVFSVLGSTGNVYTVTIDHKPSCDCPDALKGNHCKHILFIFLKGPILQVSQASGSWYQKALLTSELETIFAEAPLAPNATAHPLVQEAHARAIGKASSAIQGASTKKRIPGPGDDCPICYEGMHEVNENSLAFCEDCGNALHKECFQQWKTSTARGGKPLTCVWCRAIWVCPAARGDAETGAQRTSEGYLNLADISGVSPVRDTSSYYHGPTRGRRYYGYQDYND